MVRAPRLELDGNNARTMLVKAFWRIAALSSTFATPDTRTQVFLKRSYLN